MKTNKFMQDSTFQNNENGNYVIPFQIMIKSTEDPMLIRKPLDKEAMFSVGCSNNILIGNVFRENEFKKNSKGNIVFADVIAHNSFGENSHNNLCGVNSLPNVFYLKPKSNVWNKIKLLYYIFKQLKNF